MISFFPFNWVSEGWTAGWVAWGDGVSDPGTGAAFAIAAEAEGFEATEVEIEVYEVGALASLNFSARIDAETRLMRCIDSVIGFIRPIKSKRSVLETIEVV